MMLNEVLLAWGSARVEHKTAFRRENEFSKIEAEARQKGEGIWSYEPLQGDGKSA